jgi:hypothetical protein
LPGVHARWGRFCALSGDSAGAQYHYLEAIDRASTEEMFDEAADWLYALRTVRYLYGESSSNDEHSLAHALRPQSRPSSLPGSQHTGELALGAMLDETTPKEALQRCERWRWQAVVRAQVTEERRAVEGIGTLLEREGDIAAAIQSYVRAGDYKKASAAAGNLPDRPALIGPSLLTPVPPARAAAFAAAAASADLLDDREALAWLTDAMAEITPSDGSNPITTGAPAQHAFDVLASMCELMPPEQADALLNLLDKIIERPANHYRTTDKATARILLALAYRPAAPPILARAIIADDVMAGIILGRPDVLEAHRDVLAERLTPFAANNREACRAIIRSGADPTIALTLAQTVVEQELAPRTSEPNTYTGYAGAPDAAILASILDQETRNRFAITMLDRVQDQHQVQYSRWNDLAGLFNIAPYLDQATQEYVLSGVMEVARGQHIGDPLVSFDFDMRLAHSPFAARPASVPIESSARRSSSLV